MSLCSCLRSWKNESDSEGSNMCLFGLFGLGLLAIGSVVLLWLTLSCQVNVRIVDSGNDMDM
jgi:hypothetical protein